MSKRDMTFEEFSDAAKATNNKNGNWTVEFKIKEETKQLSVRNCTTEYEAKERVFLYLLQALEYGRRSNNSTIA